MGYYKLDLPVGSDNWKELYVLCLQNYFPINERLEKIVFERKEAPKKLLQQTKKEKRWIRLRY